MLILRVRVCFSRCSILGRAFRGFKVRPFRILRAGLGRLNARARAARMATLGLQALNLEF